MLAVICALIAASAIFAQANQEANVIAVPEIPIIRSPYATDEIFGMDFAAIDALFPRELEVTYENGVIFVKDFGAGLMEYSSGNIFKEMTLVDGYWTVEANERDDANEFVYAYFSDAVNTREGRAWTTSFYNARRDPYITLNDYDNNVSITIGYDYQYVGNSYSVGNCNYADDYRNGVLANHQVTNPFSNELDSITYDADRNLLYISFYFYDGTGWMYYFPDNGWSSSWVSYKPAEAPEGYSAELDIDYYVSLAPAICKKHLTWENGTCTVCGVVCTHQVGMDAQTGNCSDCGTSIANVKLTLANGANSFYLTLEEAIEEASKNTDSTITLLADANPTVTSYFAIEDGKFTIDLNGFDIFSRTNTTLLLFDCTVTVMDDSQEPGYLHEMINMGSDSRLIVNGGVYQDIQMNANTALTFQKGIVVDQ